MSNDDKSHLQAIEKITQPFDAMHIAQLTAFAFGLPPLYFCREYQSLDEENIVIQCHHRLFTLVNKEEISLQKISELLTEKEYFEAYEARLRVAPEPIE